MQQPLDELIAAAEIGEEARKFLASDLGKCVVGMAEQEMRAAQEALGTVDPKDTETIIKLQRKIWNASHFREYLIELMHEGEAAISIYKQQRS